MTSPENKDGNPSSLSPVAIKPDQLFIRRMKTEDVPGVMEIESVSFGTHHWAKESFLNEMNNQLGRYYSLTDFRNNKIIGYFGYWLILDEVHITTIAVHPEYRGNSLGELQLVQLLEKVLGQTVHWVTLEVRTSNYSAQNLYYKYSFESAGLRHKYYQDNREDALIMTTPNITSQSFRGLYNRNKHQLIEKIGGYPQGFEF